MSAKTTTPTPLNKIATGSPVSDTNVRDMQKVLGMRRVLQTGLLGVGLGAGMRGLAAIPRIYPQETKPAEPLVIRVDPATGKPAVKKRKKVADVPTTTVDPATKAIKPTQSIMQDPLGNAAFALSQGAGLLQQGLKSPRGPAMANLAGDNASGYGSMPWFYPSMLGLGAAGMALGHTGADAVLQSQKKDESEDELEEAKREYQRAINESYQSKSAYAALDQLAEVRLKQAGKEPPALPPTGDGAAGTVIGAPYNLMSYLAPDAAGAATGLYLTALGGIGAGGLYAGHRWARGVSPQKQLGKVVKRKRREELRNNPEPINIWTEPART